MMGWIKTLIAAFVAIVLGTVVSTIPPFPGWFASVEANQTYWLITTAGIAFLGFTLMMGGIIALIMSRGEPLGHEGAEDVSRSVRMAPLQPAVTRSTAYRVWGDAEGRAANDRFSFREMKEAWRGGAWRKNSTWRRRFITAGGALLMTIGLCGVAFSYAPAPIKVIVAAALLYAVTMIVRGFRRA